MKVTIRSENDQNEFKSAIESNDPNSCFHVENIIYFTRCVAAREILIHDVRGPRQKNMKL